MQNAINRPAHPGVAKKPSDIAKISKEAAAPKEKRPPTGYQLFCHHNREVAKKEFESTRLQLQSKEESKVQLEDASREIPSTAKILSRMWQETDAAAKKVWTDKAKPAQDVFKMRKKEKEKEEAKVNELKAETKTLTAVAPQSRTNELPWGWQPSVSELALLPGYSSMGAPLMSGYSSMCAPPLLSAMPGPSLFSSAPPSRPSGRHALGAGDEAPLFTLPEIAVPPASPAAYFPGATGGNLLDWPQDFSQGEPGLF